MLKLNTRETCGIIDGQEAMSVLQEKSGLLHRINRINCRAIYLFIACVPSKVIIGH